jgi:hypothetical protein
MDTAKSKPNSVAGRIIAHVNTKYHVSMKNIVYCSRKRTRLSKYDSKKDLLKLFGIQMLKTRAATPHLEKEN